MIKKVQTPYTGKLRISLVQVDLVWQEPATNLDRIGRLLAPLAGRTDLILLPETFTTGFTMETDRLAEETDGAASHWMANQAWKLNAVIAGSIIVREGKHYYNRLLWVTPDHETGYYDKRHLFRMGGEDIHFSPGAERKVFTCQGWRVCPMICYDLRFPVWSRNRNDYDVLVYLANWPAPRRQVWKTLLAARAIENQCYVAAVNRIGKDGNSIAYTGDSLVADPKGGIIACLDDEEVVETVSLSYQDLIAFREKFPVHLDGDDFTIL